MKTLFDLPHNGTPTSIAAAEHKASTGSAQSDRNRIAVYLHDNPSGATRQQIAHVLGISDNSVRPRCLELIQLGFVVQTSEQRVWGGHLKSSVLVHHSHVKGAV